MPALASTAVETSFLRDGPVIAKCGQHDVQSLSISVGGLRIGFILVDKNVYLQVSIVVVHFETFRHSCVTFTVIYFTEWGEDD